MDEPPTPDPKASGNTDTEYRLEFEDPAYLTEERVEELLQDVAKMRRRMTRSQRREVKKAAKFARYPIGRCVVGRDWGEQRFCAFAFTREKPSGDVVFGSGVVDLGTQGLKDGNFEPAVSEAQADKVIDGVARRGAGIEKAEPALVQKILEHGVAFAGLNGFAPPRVYFALDRLLGDHDLSKVETKVPLGHRGKPILIPGPNDDPEALAETLTETVGANGFYTPRAVAEESESGGDGTPKTRGADGSAADADSTPDVANDDDSDIIMPGDF